MCYIEENIRKQIEIAILLTAFFRILLNKLPLCSASSYSWTSSRKSNLELIKKVQRLWRGCFFLFLIEAALLIDLSQYLNHPKIFTNKRDWNLVIWVYHQEQFFLFMFKVWRKNFRLSTIWHIFGIFSARKTWKLYAHMRQFVKSPRCKNFFILTSTKKNSQLDWNKGQLIKLRMFTSVLLAYSAKMVSSQFCWSRRSDAGTEEGGRPPNFWHISSPYSNQVGGADSVYSLKLAPSIFFTFRHLWDGHKISWKLRIISKQSSSQKSVQISNIKFYFNFRFKPGDRTSKSLRMIQNCDTQQPQAQPQLCQADVVAWWPLKTPFWIRWSKRPQLKEAIRVIF